MVLLAPFDWSLPLPRVAAGPRICASSTTSDPTTLRCVRIAVEIVDAATETPACRQVGETPAIDVVGLRAFQREPLERGLVREGHALHGTGAQRGAVAWELLDSHARIGQADLGKHRDGI